MKVGLLVCDHVDAQYQETFGDYPEMFARLFPEITFRNFDATIGELPSPSQTFDAIMITGSRHSVYEDIDWITDVLAFVKGAYEEKQCIVGLCFGHQIIGQALGGRVEKSLTGWCVGVHTFVPMDINLLMMCQDQIVQLPENAEVLGGNPKCPNGIIQIDNHILGIQAHPEFSKTYDRLLMEKRIDRMGAAVVRDGIESLDKEVHTERIRNFILHFIKNSGQ